MKSGNQPTAAKSSTEQAMDISAHLRSAWHRFSGWVAGIPARVAIAIVRGYQLWLSPVFGGQCRFHPSCSEYYILSVKKHGALVGSLRGAWRILRCHPFHQGGYDPP